ncbi:uncharacterized protein J3R85_010185 [Psidium guajava]|nr:uncharacterized protein J3R85_010185 [Psidium guajava]
MTSPLKKPTNQFLIPHFRSPSLSLAHAFSSGKSRLLRLFRDCCGRMAGHKIVHATLTGPSVVKEILIGITLGMAAGGLWKMHHWNEQRKVRAFYDLLEKGEISVVAEE